MTVHASVACHHERSNERRSEGQAVPLAGSLENVIDLARRGRTGIPPD